MSQPPLCYPFLSCPFVSMFVPMLAARAGRTRTTAATCWSACGRLSVRSRSTSRASTSTRRARGVGWGWGGGLSSSTCAPHERVTGCERPPVHPPAAPPAGRDGSARPRTSHWPSDHCQSSCSRAPQPQCWPVLRPWWCRRAGAAAPAGRGVRRRLRARVRPAQALAVGAAAAPPRRRGGGGAGGARGGGRRARRAARRGRARPRAGARAHAPT